MKFFTMLFSTTVLISLLSAESMPVKEEGVKYIKMLGGALKSQLKAKMKEDKTGLTALVFCTSSADKITNEVNHKLPSYAKVRRTSLKVRNDKNNGADSIDKKVMEAYRLKIENKTFNPKEIVTVQEGDIARIYKPLITKAVCLKCHGSHLNPKIAEAILSAYPHDKARGFKEGDLRGVIVAEIKKH